MSFFLELTGNPPKMVADRGARKFPPYFDHFLECPGTEALAGAKTSWGQMNTSGMSSTRALPVLQTWTKAPGGSTLPP